MYLVLVKGEVHFCLQKSLLQVIKIKCFKVMHSFWDCSRRTNDQHVQNYCNISHHVVFSLVATPAFLCAGLGEQE